MSIKFWDQLNVCIKNYKGRSIYVLWTEYNVFIELPLPMCQYNSITATSETLTF